MKKYLSYFQMRFNTMLQYRASAIAGVCTQFFWGLMQILIYIAFYKSATSNNISLEQLVSYVWLRQAFFSLLNHITDPEIRTCVESGNISYELTKPLDLYWMWYSKTVSSRLSTALLKCLPILLITAFLPVGYSLKLPINWMAAILFLISIVLGTLIMSAVVNLFYVSIFYTTTSKGTVSIFYAILEFFGGGFIPIALMPLFWQRVCYIVPFGLATDLPFRIYTGNISAINRITIYWFAISMVDCINIYRSLIIKQSIKESCNSRRLIK